jgi:hypothetical protein
VGTVAGDDRSIVTTLPDRAEAADGLRAADAEVRAGSTVPGALLAAGKAPAVATTATTIGSVDAPPATESGTARAGATPAGPFGGGPIYVGGSLRASRGGGRSLRGSASSGMRAQPAIYRGGA